MGKSDIFIDHIFGEPALVRRECARNYLSTKMGGLKGKHGWGPGNIFNLEGGGESVLRTVSGEKSM